MNKKLILIVAGLLLIQPASFAAENNTWRDSQGAAVKNNPSVQSTDGFGAQLLITDDKDYMKKWQAPEAEPFRVRVADKAVIDQPLFVLIVFANPGVDKKKYHKVTADIVITDPKGKVYGQTGDGTCSEKVKVPKGNNIQLCQTGMGIIIRKDDPIGKYAVEAKVKDHIKNIEVKVSGSFDVDAAVEQKA